MKKISQIFDYNEKCAVPDQLFTPQSGVELHDGRFKTVFDNNRQFLHLLEMDRMTYWFDVKTGTPTSAEPYRGHFEDNLKGSTLSMFLMGAGNALRWVDDESLKTKVDILMERLKTSMEPDGFMMPVDKKRFAYREYPHYVRIWLTYGLGAVGMSGNEDGYTLLRKWQDWFNQCEDLPIIKYLELAFQGVVASGYEYFTPVGKKEDIDISIQHYEEPWRLAQFMRREPDAVHIRQQPGKEPHAHGSELEAIEGYLDYYRATGRNYYLDAVLGAWELYRRDWQHAGGGIVMCEYMPKNYPGCRWINPEYCYNELCCTSFWLYLNLRLHRLFPEEEVYMNEVEKSLYNIAFANQDGADGIRYFGYMEQRKQVSGLNHCCCGVGTRIYGSLPEYVYSVNKDTLSVNLYTPSAIDWEGVHLENDSEIPYRDQVCLTLSMEESREFTLRLRIPSWATETVPVYVNGNEVLTAEPGTYAAITRIWNPGDVITYRLPMDFRLTKYEGADELRPFSRYAIEYGPILYAVTAPSWQNARMIGWSVSDYKEWLEPADTPLVYTIRQHPGFALVPYMDVDKEQFSCYPIFAEDVYPENGKEQFSYPIYATGNQ